MSPRAGPASARKSTTNEGSRVSDLEKRLAETSALLQEKDRALTEALDQQTAASEILRVISQSQTDAQPVFDAIAQAALRLCEAKHGTVFLFDRQLIHLAAVAGTDPEGSEAVRQSFPRPPGRTSTTTRALRRRWLHFWNAPIKRGVRDSV